MPDIKFAAADVASMKLGTTNVSKVMLGTVEVWPGAAACTDVLSEPFNDVSAWTYLSGQVAIFPAGRTGTGVSATGASTHQGLYNFTIPALSESDTVTLGFAMKITTVSSANNALLFNFRSDTGATDHMDLRMGSSGGMTVRNQGAIRATAAAGTIVNATWCYLELQIRMHDTLGFVTLKKDGVTVASATNVDTKAGGTKTTFDQLRMTVNGSGWGTVIYDDLYLSTGVGCAFKGDQVIVLPGTCTDVLSEPFDDLSAWTTVAGSPTIVAGRTGTALQIDSSDEAVAYTIPAPDRSNTVTIGFAFQVVTVSATENALMTLLSDSGTTEHLQLTMQNDGNMNVYVGSSGKGGTGTGSIPEDSWVYVEVQATMADTGGTIKVRIDGVLLIDYIGDTRNGGTSTLYDTVRLGTGHWSHTYRYDDLYLSTGAGCPFGDDPHPPPISLTGLKLWLDADDASTFTYSSGTVVSQWSDKSGNGYHMSIPTTGNQPSRSGTQNGRPTVVYDGTADHLANVTAPLSTATDNFTLVVACKRTSGGVASHSVVFHNGQPDSNGWGLMLRAASANIGLLRGGIQVHSTATPDPLAAGVLTLRRTSGTWSLHLNGTATNLTTTAAPSTPTGLTLLGSNSHLFGGEVYEVAFYDRALSDAERGQVESYLKTKWGTP